jgi:protein O-mannosyl-transferase
MGVAVLSVQKSTTTNAPRSQGLWKDLLFALSLAIAVFIVYYPAHHYPFIDIDDDAYVYNDAHVMGPLNWSTVQWGFSHYYCDNYVPIDFLSHNLDVQLFQTNAGGHHDVNVLFHALNAILLFWILKRATGYTGRSLMVAALFALHPINVENVAWIAERKTLLSTFFFLLAIAAYRWYASNRKDLRMAVVALFFVLALLAKPQVIALPFVLLLWDYWPLRRMILPGVAPAAATAQDLQPEKLSSLISEKFLLFGIAGVDAALTMAGETGMRFLKLPLYIRLGNAILSYATFIKKAFWPSGLALMYLHPGHSISWMRVFLAFVLLCIVSVLVAVKWRQRYLPVGWLWFLGTMVPTIGIVQIDVHALADRYAYIAFIGLFIMVCWGVAEWWEKRALPVPALVAASLVIVLALGVTTRHQLGFWKDRVTLWNHTIDATGRNWVADDRLGSYYSMQGNYDRAFDYYSRAVEEKPDDFGVNERLAMTEHLRGHLQEAVVYYQKALALSPDDKTSAQLWANLGHAYSDLGDPQKAQECYRSAQRLAAPAPPSSN